MVTILQDGQHARIPAHHLKKGQLVLVQTGDIVPADLALDGNNLLEVDEFEITGEIMPVIKSSASETSFVFAGTRVIRGSAYGRVVAIGEETEYGRIQQQSAALAAPDRAAWLNKSHQTCLYLLLPALALSLSRAPAVIPVIFWFLAACAALFFLVNKALFRQWLVGAARSALLKRRIVLRDPRGLETFHGLDAICFDKTGVLTTREVAVEKIYFGRNLSQVFPEASPPQPDVWDLTGTACALCTDLTHVDSLEHANPVDRALIAFAKQIGLDYTALAKSYRRAVDIPFDPEKRYMACGYETQDRQMRFFLKGDPEVVLQKCAAIYVDAKKKVRLNLPLISKIRDLGRAVHQDGHIPIAIAVAEGSAAPDASGYTFLGIVQFENNLQSGAEETVRQVLERGIRPILITGDRPAAAVKVAQLCGISPGSSVSLTGRMMNRMPLDEVRRQARTCSVFSMMTPSQKGVIIRLLQSSGLKVAMVGDGPNDSIALKVADAGVSFNTYSSPFARRAAGTLIEQLADLIALLDESARLQKRRRAVELIRSGLIALVFAAVYLRTLLFFLR